MAIFPENMIKGRRNPLLSDECLNLLNYRIQQEEQSSRIYLAMSLWLNNEGYTGAAKLWRKYSDEELAHADWSREYLLSMGVTPNTQALTAEPNTYQGLPQIIELSYNHEIDVTKQVKELGDKAFKVGDHMLYTLVGQYLKEQVEEHVKFQDLMDKLKTFGISKEQLFQLDNYLATV